MGKFIKKIFFNELRKHLGSDIMVQTKLNLSIQMPNDRILFLIFIQIVGLQIAFSTKFVDTFNRCI